MNMDFIKNFEPTPLKLVKLVGILVAALVVLAVAAQMFAPSLPVSMLPGAPGMDAAYPSEMGVSYSTDNYDGGYGYASAKQVSAPTGGYAGGIAQSGITLSARNLVPITNINPSMPPFPGSQPSGDTAEDYEVTDYSAQIETRKLNQTCAAFAELKEKDYVVFESSNKYDSGCSFSFKVEHARVAEVLAWIKDLDPRYLNENTYTIKKQVDDFTSEEDILKKKLADIDATLKSATAAYDQVTRLATQTEDASSLAQIIQSRIQIIQQLTQEKLNVSEQLERLARAKAESLDHLDYTYFNVNVAENKFIDTEAVKDSWKQSVRDVVHVINGAMQGVTINLIALFVLLVQYALYALILLLVVKYGWQTAVKIWKK